MAGSGPSESEILSQKLTRLHSVSLDLSMADSVDRLCRMAVELGTRRLGFDRLGIWFFDPENPEVLVGTYGVDEAGDMRHEEDSRVPVDHELMPAAFLDGTLPYVRQPSHAVYDHTHRQVGVADLALAPIWNGRMSMGAISADNLLTGTPMDETMCQILSLLARTVGHLATLKQTETELRESRERLEVLASRDGLTGLVNRRTGLEMLEQQMRLVRREGGRLSVCFMDLDRLKAVNDGFGHEAGDRYILTLVGIVQANVRESDVVCRLGGDEFMVILPRSNAARAEQVLRRIAEQGAASTALRQLKDPPHFSFGVVEYRGEHADADEILRRADELMYRQKAEHHVADAP
jgi:diguanylate cyclase (GGDEF)-like protein